MLKSLLPPQIPLLFPATTSILSLQRPMLVGFFDAGARSRYGSRIVTHKGATSRSHDGGFAVDPIAREGQ
ncbi:hypothetical protein TIFTF001_049850 [Ficus carica]|uniref:Uncharacterized protein n=1 Tax=Ficus carica TaxID=3494 RepID=A0AA87YNP8_FICCA|nr:hypothetical protein TIFTF001_049850 [Ficus carica]